MTAKTDRPRNRLAESIDESATTFAVHRSMFGLGIPDGTLRDQARRAIGQAAWQRLEREAREYVLHHDAVPFMAEAELLYIHGNVLAHLPHPHETWTVTRGDNAVAHAAGTALVPLFGPARG